METCLFKKALPSNGPAYLLIKNLLPISECFFVAFSRFYPVTALYVTILTIASLRRRGHAVA
jgi:hypothetical protein